jgi:hypothetical protein
MTLLPSLPDPEPANASGTYGVSLTRQWLLIVAGVLTLMVALTFIALFLGGAKVPLLTGRGGLNVSNGVVGCYTSGITGDLVTDQSFGTAIVMHDPYGKNPDYRLPVMWTPGYTGRQSGSEVEVLKPNGSVWARTGTTVSMGGGEYGESPRVWVACGWIKTLP